MLCHQLINCHLCSAVKQTHHPATEDNTNYTRCTQLYRKRFYLLCLVRICSHHFIAYTYILQFFSTGICWNVLVTLRQIVIILSALSASYPFLPPSGPSLYTNFVRFTLLTTSQTQSSKLQATIRFRTTQQDCLNSILDLIAFNVVL